MKKASKNIITILAILIAVASCIIAVYQHKKYNDHIDKYNEVVKSFNDLNNEHSTLVSDYNKLTSDYNELSEKYDTLSNDYNTLSAEYTEHLKSEEVVYDTPSDLSEYDTGITYDNIARTPDDYEGKAIKLTGEVVQVIDDGDSIQLRVAVNNDYNQMVYCIYDSGIVSQRVLEQDVITMYGISANLISYESTMGGTITIPMISVDYIEFN